MKGFYQALKWVVSWQAAGGRRQVAGGRRQAAGGRRKEEGKGMD
jgi:hypothetical protein